ncbi:uncharacterized protein LOC107617788 [Arachis ipaensis]|uniref:uncharacterized protein LOC107617788 n=1 Tax=Arachis ipaensis TaxID=130454 RepID=UPI0007AF7D7E|nr:uncharacterized protein LOC107617788 [Arachis ipaensis]XP_025627635.1 uncharacterized protein LOC112720773 [Arachis hypogaea]QHO19758.1 uncharacterized protein DS421_11g331860 [Arachis hypogaea]
MKTKARLSKSLDRDVTTVESFKYTHTLQENKERFAYQQSTNHYESYTKSLEAATQQSQHTGDDGNNSITLIIDPDIVWCKIASKPYKNRVYELGSFFADNFRTSTLRHSSAFAASRPVDPEDGVDLGEHVLELTWRLHQQAQ